MAEKKTVAVLIDGENIDPSFAEQIFTYANSLGTPAVREIYGSGVALNDWSDPILRHTIHTNFTLRPNRFKNSSDIALVIGAMELLAASRASGEGPGSTAVLIVSSDSDFSPLAVHLRAAGVDVIGMGEPKNTNAMWPKACTKFVELTAAPSQAQAKSERKSAAEQEKKAAGKTPENPSASQSQPQQEKKASQQQSQPAPVQQVQQPQQAEKKPAPAVKQPAQTGEQNEAEKTQAPAAERNERTIAPSHRARVEIIRKFVEDQIAAHDGRIKSGELFKALISLPDYKYDQQRSRRNPLDYLEKQYSDWFEFEAGEKGSSWITVKSAAVSGPASTAVYEEPVAEPAPAEAAQEQQPVPEETAPAAQPEKEPEAAPHELTLEESLTEAGIPFKDAVRAANILPKCRNMRDVYNRMRGAFGKEDGKTYYEAVKVLVKTAVFSFPEREKEEAAPVDKSDLPLTKEEILAMTAAENAEKPSVRSEQSAVSDEGEAAGSDETTDTPGAEEIHAGDEAGSGSPHLTDGPIRFLMERGVTSDRAMKIVSIFNESPNQRVAYNELRKAFGNKGRQYLGMMKEYKGENENA